MSTRADNFTQLRKTPDLFSDFMQDLTPHPISHDIGRLRNDHSIKQALKNIIMTNLGERPFQPNLGSDVMNSLFEPNSIITRQQIKSSIENAVKFHEPRVHLIEVNVNTRESDETAIDVNIVFSIINSIDVLSLNLILRRVR